jgi:hypothetical protein
MFVIVEIPPMKATSEAVSRSSNRRKTATGVVVSVLLPICIVHIIPVPAITAVSITRSSNSVHGSPLSADAAGDDGRQRRAGTTVVHQKFETGGQCHANTGAVTEKLCE